LFQHPHLDPFGFAQDRLPPSRGKRSESDAATRVTIFILCGRA
jgi:hypothetical protein